MNYNYDDRYLAEAVYTRGGYNWLAPDNRWADYWGVGASWNGHNESFVKDLNIFSTLKPRISYAVTGQAICDYAEYRQSIALLRFMCMVVLLITNGQRRTKLLHVLTRK